MKISINNNLKTTTELSGHCNVSMDLKGVLGVLEQLAPLSLAESWDNVGLLVEPSRPRPIKTILLTNDLTSAVMDEAEEMACDLVISYHPPLFRPFKRLLQKDWKQRLAVRAVEGGIAVFSPHTSWDSAKDGLNDWLIGGLGYQALCSAPQRHRVEFTAGSQVELDSILKLLKETENSEAFQYTLLRYVIFSLIYMANYPTHSLGLPLSLVMPQHQEGKDYHAPPPTHVKSDSASF
uniref:NIF3-like protein 1 n=1 Tax=Astyanax mexicanus TaxID=7994 RepID=A0A8B9K646_ASTMX